MQSSNRIVWDDEDALQNALRPRDLLLGEDGCVHVGDVVEKMSAALMETSCGVVPLRPIRYREGGWWTAPDRACEDCGAQEAHASATRTSRTKP